MVPSYQFCASPWQGADMGGHKTQAGAHCLVTMGCVVSVTSAPQLGQQRLWGSQQRQQHQQSVNSRQRLAEDKQRRVSEVIPWVIWILAPNEAHRHRHGGDGDGGQWGDQGPGLPLPGGAVPGLETVALRSPSPHLQQSPQHRDPPQWSVSQCWMVPSAPGCELICRQQTTSVIRCQTQLNSLHSSHHR